MSTKSPLLTRRNVVVAASLSLVSGAAAGAATVFGMPDDGSAKSANQTAGSNGAPASPDGQAGGANTTTFDYTGTYSGTIEADGVEVESTDEVFEATQADVCAALVENGGTLTLTSATLAKSGDDTNGDNCNFYGVNSVLTAVGEGSTAYVASSSLTAESEGSNGIFSTDSATVMANDVHIESAQGNSRGLDATYSGTILAANLTVTTQGDHCAGIATDRGGGSISCTDSTIQTGGSGSPILYSTGNIQVKGITGSATGSQIAGMEGLNTILVKDSELTSSTTGKTASDPVADGIIIYQSTSGDAEAATGSTATFQAAGSKLKSAIAEGAMFYLTNTQASIVLSDTELDFDSTAAKLLYAAGNNSNSWGSAGSNGATVTFTGRGQELAGDICVDTISSADVYLLENTTWTGAASIEENADGGTAVETPLSVSVDATSTWVVTADSEITALALADGASLVDEDGKTVSVVTDGKTAVQGESDLTVTVTTTYTTEVSAGTETELASDDSLIDRSTFDDHFDTDTAWTM